MEAANSVDLRQPAAALLAGGAELSAGQRQLLEHIVGANDEHAAHFIRRRFQHEAYDAYMCVWSPDTAQVRGGALWHRAQAPACELVWRARR